MFQPVAVTSSWLEAMLNADVDPDQLLPIPPLARLKLSSIELAGKPPDKVAVAVGVFVLVAVAVDVGVKVAVLTAAVAV